MSRVAAVKRSSLADMAEGWDDECYAYVRPATYEDMLSIDDAEISTKSKREQVEFQTKFVSDHWVSGKVKVLGDNGQFVLSDMEVGDCLVSQAITDKLYMDIIGVNLDPKDLAALQAANVTQTQPELSESSTETPSSTEAQPSVAAQPES